VKIGEEAAPQHTVDMYKEGAGWGHTARPVTAIAQHTARARTGTTPTSPGKAIGCCARSCSMNHGGIFQICVPPVFIPPLWVRRFALFHAAADHTFSFCPSLSLCPRVPLPLPRWYLPPHAPLRLAESHDASPRHQHTQPQQPPVLLPDQPGAAGLRHPRGWKRENQIPAECLALAKEAAAGRLPAAECGQQAVRAPGPPAAGPHALPRRGAAEVRRHMCMLNLN
jgi:hypothetical protein